MMISDLPDDLESEL